MSKRWKVMLWPMAVEHSFPSQKQTYNFVNAARDSYAEGKSRISHIDVKVSEDKGPWALYEKLDFRR